MNNLPVLPQTIPDKDKLIAQALADRGIAPAVYDFIKYNLGEGAAVVAILTGAPQHHCPPEGPCGCS